jgi:hypothetical protein
LHVQAYCKVAEGPAWWNIFTFAEYISYMLPIQASFDPPGLSVAVKKDRAAEALLTTGAKFNVNILAEGREKAVMKQLLKPFKPGEDRFAGMDIQVRAGFSRVFGRRRVHHCPVHALSLHVLRVTASGQEACT